MDAQIIINSIDQTAYLLSISRSYNYCSVSQEFTIDLDISCPTTINTYDPIVIYEEGVKVLTGYVGNITKKAPEAKMTIKGQDVYVKANDFFVPTTYTTDFGQTVQYWVTFLLNLAGLTATFTDGTGPFVVAEQEIGFAPVADILVQMLQYAGWYGRVDPNGTVIFGKVDKIPLSDQIIEGVNILSDEIDQSYDKTRNKAIVFGGIDTVLNRFEQIISVAELDMPTLPVDQTVVIGNPLIADQDSADDFAQALVNEFAKLTQIKQIKILGNPNFQAGKFVEIHSDIFTGIALITSMRSDFSESGYTMDLTLDDPCPRIVGAIKHQPELYAGTLGDGVWAYNMYSGAWEDISAGLTNLYINDLSVDNGLFITATPAGIYTKLASNNWVKQNLPLYSGATGTLIYSGVYANLFDNQVHAIVTSDNPDFNYAWFYTGTIASGGTGFRWSGSPIGDIEGNTYSGEYYSATDLEGNYGSKYISTRYQIDDSQEIIFFTFENRHIFSMGLDGANLSSVQETQGFDSVTDADISHDMTRITFTGEFGPGGSEIYTAKFDGSNRIRVTSMLFDSSNPSWSPSDNEIVFVHDDSEICIIGLDGSGLSVLPLATATYERPRYINSSRIVFGKRVSSVWQIFSANTDGSDLTQLTNNAWDSRLSTFNEPLGKIVYTADVGAGNVDTYTMNADGSDNQLSYNFTADLSSPDFTDPQGKFIMFSSNGRVWLAGTVNQAQSALTTGGDAPSEHDLALIGTGDGNDIVFYTSSTSTIKQVNTDGSNNVEFFDASPNFVKEMVRSTTKERFAFAVHDHPAAGVDSFVNFYISDGVTASVVPNSLDFHNWAFSTQPYYSVHPTADKIAVWVPKEDASVGDHLFDVFEIGDGAAGRLTNNEHDFPTSNNPIIHYSPNGTKIAYGISGDPNRIFINGVDSYAGIFREWGPDDDTIIFSKDDAGHTLPDDLYEFNMATTEERLLYVYEVTESPTNLQLSPDGSFLLVNEGHGLGLDELLYITPYNNPGIKTLIKSTTTDAIWTSDGESIVFRGTEADDDLYIVSMKVELAEGSFPSFRSGQISARTRVFETFNNTEFHLIFEDTGIYMENNVDIYSPITVYGRDGNWYATDFMTYSGVIASGLITYDVAARSINSEKQLFATTSHGIYKTIVSGIPVLKNAVGATEIVSRYYGSGEIFFSVGAQVKQSLTECSTYTDISSGLPGSTITVLRLDK